MIHLLVESGQGGLATGQVRISGESPSVTGG